ncbi:MAG: hypothetical protein ACU85V_11545 [Gammaproteobacteria bacterium]
MSLINDMLNDLERRRGGAPGDGVATLDGVRAVGVGQAAGRGGALVLTALVAVAATLATWFVLERHRSGLAVEHGAHAPAAAAVAPALAARTSGSGPAQSHIPALPSAVAAPASLESEIAAVSDPSAAMPVSAPEPEPEPEPAAGSGDAAAPVVAAAVGDPASPDVLAADRDEPGIETESAAAAVSYGGTVSKTPLPTVEAPDAALRRILERVTHDRSALPELAEFVNVHPAPAGARAAYAGELLRGGDVAAAEVVLETGLERDPGDLAIHLILHPEA